MALLQIFTKQRKSRFIENRPTKNTFLKELFKNDVTSRKICHDDKRGLYILQKMIMSFINFKQPLISASNITLFYARDKPRMETNKFPHNVAFSSTWILRHRRRLPPFVTGCLKNPNCTTLPVQNEIAPILEIFLKTQQG